MGEKRQAGDRSVAMESGDLTNAADDLIGLGEAMQRDALNIKDPYVRMAALSHPAAMADYTSDGHNTRTSIQRLSHRGSLPSSPRPAESPLPSPSKLNAADQLRRLGLPSNLHIQSHGNKIPAPISWQWGMHTAAVPHFDEK